MKLRTAKLGLIVIALCAAQLPVAAADILPTAVGNKWEYTCVKLIRATIAHSGLTVANMRVALPPGTRPSGYAKGKGHAAGNQRCREEP